MLSGEEVGSGIKARQNFFVIGTVVCRYGFVLISVRFRYH